MSDTPKQNRPIVTLETKAEGNEPISHFKIRLPYYSKEFVIKERDINDIMSQINTIKSKI